MSATVDHRIVVADQHDNTIKIIGEDNTIMQTVGGKGWGTEAFDLPGDVTSSFLLDLFVTDNNNRRVQRYNKQMQFIQGYSEESVTEAGRIQPVASATAVTGEFFILEADGKRILRLNPRSVIDKEFGNKTTTEHNIREPKDIAVSNQNEVFVLDGFRVLVFDIYGNFIRTIVLLSTVEWRTLSVSGPWLLVTGLNQIQMFQTETNVEWTIFPSTIIGEKITDPFSDALIMNDRLILLTTTTIYRCVFTIP